MGILREIWNHPEDLYLLFKLKLAVMQAGKRIPPQPRWGFCYSMLYQFSPSKSFIIQQLRPELRDAVCIFYLVLRALDTVDTFPLPIWRVPSPRVEAFLAYSVGSKVVEYVSAMPFKDVLSTIISHVVFLSLYIYPCEDVLLGGDRNIKPFVAYLCSLKITEDDTSVPTEVKVPILMAFHRHIYDRNWHFTCGMKEYKVLMDQFHNVSTAFLELGRSYQEAIEEITMRMGAGMAKFICKEVETIDEYDEYCHYVAGLVGLGLLNIFHASGSEITIAESLSISMGLFLQKTNIIRDYLEDINEIPKSRMFWPREIWSKYVNKLEDMKYEENTAKAVHCLNDMVTNALIHVEDCLKCMSDLQDPAVVRFCAMAQIVAIGTLALCYNNISVFRGKVRLRHGLTAKIIDRTRTMADVYRAFYDFACMLKSKVDMNDPNAMTTLSRINAIQDTCRNSGLLTTRKSYILESEPKHNTALIVVFLTLAILFAFLFVNRSEGSRSTL